MNKIIGMFNISNTDSSKFVKEFINTINVLQEDNQEIEIQYKVNSFSNGQLVYSALILGRKRGE